MNGFQLDAFAVFNDHTAFLWDSTLMGVIIMELMGQVIGDLEMKPLSLGHV
jgi:hypothetical protein